MKRNERLKIRACACASTHTHTHTHGGGVGRGGLFGRFLHTDLLEKMGSLGT